MMSNKDFAQRILPLIDLTSLNDSDNEQTIRKLCSQAITDYGEVAAVCIYPRFIKLAKKCLSNTNIKIATVCNFPKGNQNQETILKEIKHAIQNGADEIDLVIPYHDYLIGNKETTKELVSACKNICGAKIHLKVILETGVLIKPELIASASEDVIIAGADFLKTSTGKVAVGATIEAAEIMLLAIKNAKRKVGFKAAGGIRTVEQAALYLQIADQIMGSHWVSPDVFRFGASSLLNDVLNCF